MTPREQFLQIYRAARMIALGALDVAFDRALKDEDAGVLAALRLRRRAWLDFPENVVDGTRADLMAQWPSDLQPCPAWFLDPEGEPVGDTVEIDLSAKLEPEP